MSALGFFILLAASALVFAAYYLSIRRAFELSLDGIELHPITTADGWRLLLYRHRHGDSNGDPILLCHGFSSNHWNLNAPRGESLADYLAARGYDCWTIDLRGTRSSTPPFGTPRHRATFDGYVMEDLPTAIDYIRKLTGHDRVHWVGHSLGGTLLYAYEAAHGPNRIASGITIASPPELRPTWPQWQSHLIRVMEQAPGVFSVFQRCLAPIHAFLKPKSRMVPVDWNNLNAKFSIAEFFSAVETPPGPVTRTMEEWARHKYLAVDNDRINVLSSYARLQSPMLLLGCPLDPIVPASTVRAFFDRLPQSDKRYIELSRREGCERDYDHIDPPFAKNAATEVFAPIERWIAEHAKVAPKKIVQPAAAPVASKETPKIEPVSVSTPQPTAPAPRPEPPRPTPGPAPVAAKAEVAPAPAPTADTSKLWGRALRDAANILGGLDESPEERLEPVLAKPKRATAKTKATTKRRAAKTASAKPKKSTKKKSTAKPKPSTAGRTSTKKKAASAAKTKSKDKKKSKTKSKPKPAAEDSKKDKKKRTKSKDKSRKKKSKGKKSSKK